MSIHIAGNGAASRMEWAQEIITNDPYPGEQIVKQIEPATSTEFQTPATCPGYTELNCEKFEHPP